MKKIVAIFAILAIAITGLAGCAQKGEKNILVVSRESGSGTRDAFDALVINENGDSLALAADGTVRDAIVETADLQSATNNVLTKVATNKTAIGYTSLGALSKDVKAINIDGVAATAEAVLDGSYKLQRPFIIMTRKNYDLTSATADFLRYLKSTDAQNIISGKLVKQENPQQIAYTSPETAINGIVSIKGSTSVDPYMDLLIADYKDKGGNNVKDVTINKDAQGSSSGLTAVKNDDGGNVISMSSSAIKPADGPSLDYFTIALDAVAVIVNNDNNIDNLSLDQLYKIYSGEIKKFSEVAK